MTAPPSIDQIDVRRARVTEHLRSGDRLLQLGDEWAAVAYFYAVYHQARVAMLEDPIFNDPVALQNIHINLRPADREAEHHQGTTKSGGRSFGVSDVVIWVYKK